MTHGLARIHAVVQRVIDANEVAVVSFETASVDIDSEADYRTV